MEPPPSTEKALKRARLASDGVHGSSLEDFPARLASLDAELVSAAREERGADGAGPSGRDVCVVVSDILAAHGELRTALADREVGGGSEEAKAAATRLERREGVLGKLTTQLEAAEEELYATLTRHRRPERPSWADELKGEDAVRHIIVHAHKISYTTFAPPGFQAGMPMRGFQPPHPVDQQMARSLLFRRGAAEAAERAREAAAAARPAEGVQGGAADGGGDLSEQDRAILALMPAGWKPGDPIPDMEPPAEPEPAPAPPKPQVSVPKVSLDLNPEEGADVVVEYSDYSEEEESSDEDF